MTKLALYIREYETSEVISREEYLQEIEKLKKLLNELGFSLLNKPTKGYGYIEEARVSFKEKSTLFCRYEHFTMTKEAEAAGNILREIISLTGEIIYCKHDGFFFRL